MASLGCLRLSALLAGCVVAFPMLAMQPLDEQSLSEVTGQAQGLRYTSEYDARIDSISYIDDDGMGDGNVGMLTLSPVRLYTQTNRPVQIDLEVKEVNGRKALVFTNRDLPIETEVGSFAINGYSLGGIGHGNFQIGTGDALVTTLYAGGNEGNGITIDLDIPGSMSFDTWLEDDGARLTATLDFGDPRNPLGGGMALKNISFDLEGDGLRIGLPEITDGNVNFYNVRIGDDVLNSAALRNVNLQPGGYLLVKNARGADEIGMEMDLLVKKDSSLDFVYITGAIGENYPGPNVFEMSANISLVDDLSVRGMRMNVDGERGLVFDFDKTNAQSGVSGNLLVSDFTMQRSDKVGVVTDPVGIGSMDIQMNLTNNTYMQIEGH
ncbi:hypothetical protein GJQ55_03520 [Venatoribacter cucullus]|uniref:DUF6160 domain-containing protein n=1 Tax=Venatoribacter cucullus TaxID=2661630 RepID=A0A9X7YNC7_9GAMM|nr:DUF6160 family protein [Venatoribacter cucullus]QQD23609.1 hypothetical protein GJQ55_03520 [Venatoribacter cucullus]